MAAFLLTPAASAANPRQSKGGVLRSASPTADGNNTSRYMDHPRNELALMPLELKSSRRPDRRASENWRRTQEERSRINKPSWRVCLQPYWRKLGALGELLFKSSAPSRQSSALSAAAPRHKAQTSRCTGRKRAFLQMNLRRPLRSSSRPAPVM